MGLVLANYIALSTIAFILYAVDKSAARKNAQRVSERSLHLVALLGGWPGAIIAQKVFRHKTKKHAFRFVFWLTVIANVSVVFLLIFNAHFIVAV
ncbi:MAG: DUF1294 domain-containing protein [Gammaproteobacteria bacterium]|nr:DUF1294 domain-containing protein [Gammaproteobacteria bacterium]